MRSRLLTALVPALVLVLVSVLPVSAAPVTYVALLSGAEEVPPVASMATGKATFVLSEDGTSIMYTLEVTGIQDVFASHIHLAPAGVNGSVVVGLFAGPKPGVFTGVLAEGVITKAELTGSLAGMELSSLIAEINAGNTYVNVHTTAHRPGEIRGQISLLPGM